MSRGTKTFLDPEEITQILNPKIGFKLTRESEAKFRRLEDLNLMALYKVVEAFNLDVKIKDYKKKSKPVLIKEIREKAKFVEPFLQKFPELALGLPFNKIDDLSVPQLHKLIQKYNADMVIKGYKKLSKDQIIEQIRAKLPHLELTPVEGVKIVYDSVGNPSLKFDKERNQYRLNPDFIKSERDEALSEKDLLEFLKLEGHGVTSRKGFGGQTHGRGHRPTKTVKVSGVPVKVSMRSTDPEDFSVLRGPTGFEDEPFEVSVLGAEGGKDFSVRGGAKVVYNIPPPAISYEEVGDSQIVSHQKINKDQEYEYPYSNTDDGPGGAYPIQGSAFNPFMDYEIAVDDEPSAIGIMGETDLKTFRDGLDLYAASGVLITSQEIARDEALETDTEDQGSSDYFIEFTVAVISGFMNATFNRDIRGVCFQQYETNNEEGNQFRTIAPYWRWKARDPKDKIVKALWNGKEVDNNGKRLVGLTSAITKMPGYRDWGMVYTGIEPDDGQKYIKVFPYDEIGRVVIVSDFNPLNDGPAEVGTLEAAPIRFGDDTGETYEAHTSIKMVKDPDYFETDEKLVTINDCEEFLKKNAAELFRYGDETIREQHWGGGYQNRPITHHDKLKETGGIRSMAYALHDLIDSIKYKYKTSQTGAVGNGMFFSPTCIGAAYRLTEFFEYLIAEDYKKAKFMDREFNNKYGDSNDKILDELLVGDESSIEIKRRPPTPRPRSPSPETVQVRSVFKYGKEYYVDDKTSIVYDTETSDEVGKVISGNIVLDGDDEEEPPFSPVSEDEGDREEIYPRLIKTGGDKYLRVDGDDLDVLRTGDTGFIDGFYYIKSSQEGYHDGEYSYDVAHKSNLNKVLLSISGQDKLKFK